MNLTRGTGLKKISIVTIGIQTYIYRVFIELYVIIYYIVLGGK